jgi:hypothetical protein
MKMSDFRPTGFFDGLDKLEFVVVAFVAGVILWIGPIILAIHLVSAHRLVPAAVVGVLWVGTVATCVRDLRRKSWSWVSTVVCVLWFVLMLAVVGVG